MHATILNEAVLRMTSWRCRRNTIYETSRRLTSVFTLCLQMFLYLLMLY